MVSYSLAQKKKVRITLELTVFDDFDARQIDWEKVFELEPAEKVKAYVEDFDRDYGTIRTKKSLKKVLEVS